MCSTSIRDKATLRMPAMPTSATARETVDTGSMPALRNRAELTTRSNFCVRATSLSSSSHRMLMFSVSETDRDWIRVTDDASAGKSVFWRMRRIR